MVPIVEAVETGVEELPDDDESKSGAGLCFAEVGIDVVDELEAFSLPVWII